MDLCLWWEMFLVTLNLYEGVRKLGLLFEVSKLRTWILICIR